MESSILRCIDDVSSGAVNDFEARDKRIVDMVTTCVLALAVPKPLSKNLVVDKCRVKFAKQVTLGTSTGVL